MLLSNQKWSVYRTVPNELDDATSLRGTAPTCLTDTASTVARALSDAEVLPDISTIDIDEYDWWYVCEFAADAESEHSVLSLDGLATIAEVWLNDQPIVSSNNMFVANVVDVSELVTDQNTLAIVFRSVSESLKDRRPRPRWKTNLVDHQQLRWIRTTLLGRIPGWTPKARAIGPWRPIRLEQGSFRAERCSVKATCNGSTGKIEIGASIRTSLDVDNAFIELDGDAYPLETASNDAVAEISGSLALGKVRLWNPHTHGQPELYDYRVVVSVGGAEQTVKTGRIGFRNVRLIDSQNKFGFLINDTEVFCRGACWTTPDILSLAADKDQLRSILQCAVDAGSNMIRIGGTMVYEHDDFYELCDELGIMVWQDFMFANMDYPIDDADFRSNVEEEIRGQAARLAAYPCVVAFCGNSEVEQQAAMFGRPPGDYENKLFYELIPEVLSDLGAGQPYVNASPTGGALPFHNGVGVSHYFGVGAYKRPVSDAASTPVLFATECLGFSNIPSDDTMRRAFGSASPVTHTPAWKEGVPRDTGPGWDFEDIRDHYFEELTGQNAVTARYADNAGYLARSATITGEVMRRTYAHWRSSDSPCSGALIWNMMDIVPGAGWGYIDSYGNRKPVFYYLKRAWSPICLSLIDKGLDGLAVNVLNESGERLECTLDVQVLRQPHTRIASLTIDVAVDAGNSRQYLVDEAIGYFLDTTYSYRFGPRGHDVVVATLVSDGQAMVSDAYFPGGYDLGVMPECQLDAAITEIDVGYRIEVQCESFLQDVVLKANGYRFSDNYFHLAPGVRKTVTAVPTSDGDARFRATLQAQNLDSPVRLK